MEINKTHSWCNLYSLFTFAQKITENKGNFMLIILIVVPNATAQ